MLQPGFESRTVKPVAIRYTDAPVMYNVSTMGHYTYEGGSQCLEGNDYVFTLQGKRCFLAEAVLQLRVRSFQRKTSRPLEAAASLEPAYCWRGLATVSRAGTAPGLRLGPYTPFADTLTFVEDDVTIPLVTTLIF